MSKYRITQQIQFCYGHRLINYDGKCAHLHGHNATAEFTFESNVLDSTSMVLDFVDVKKTMKKWIDDNLDHQMLLNENDPIVPVLKDMKEPMYLFNENPTVEVISKLLYETAARMNLPISEVRVWETPSQFAVYRKS